MARAEEARLSEGGCAVLALLLLELLFPSRAGQDPELRFVEGELCVPVVD